MAANDSRPTPSTTFKAPFETAWFAQQYEVNHREATRRKRSSQTIRYIIMQAAQAYAGNRLLFIISSTRLQLPGTIIVVVPLFSVPYSSSSLPFVAQIWGHTGGTSPPLLLPVGCSCLHFCRRSLYMTYGTYGHLFSRSWTCSNV